MTLRAHARAIFEAGVQAADAAEAVESALGIEGESLVVGPAEAEVCRVDLAACRRIVLVGAGKASAPMARAVEALLGDRVDEGLIVVKYDHAEPLAKTRLIEAGHPVPDAAGQQAAGAITALADGCGQDDLIICCLSGGGSALLPAPASGITLTDKQDLTERLLECGATIVEINTLRKHCSAIKGGQLARRAAPARVINLMLSDVVGGRADTIASGPLAPDETTFADCQAILERHRLSERIPPAVRIHLKKGLDGDVPETPTATDPCFARVAHCVVAENRTALEAAAQHAAGALADGTTVARGAEADRDAFGHLDTNDAYPFFEALEDLVITEPTRTNVMDLVCLLVGPPP
ncbi:MAG: glycerate kinase [Nitrospinota bacterium]